jgi:hypothetical protein
MHSAFFLTVNNTSYCVALTATLPGSEAAAVAKLLRLLHAMSWASSSSSSSANNSSSSGSTPNGVKARVVLPEAVEMFCNILLGKAKPPPPEEALFEDTLNSSVERALRYKHTARTMHCTVLLCCYAHISGSVYLIIDR